MKETIVRHGKIKTDVRVPKFLSLREYFYGRDISLADLILHLNENFTFPLILKPTDGAGSVEVIRLDDEESAKKELKKIQNSLLSFEVEEFIEGQVIHMNALVWNGELRVPANFRYNIPPLFFDTNHYLGHLEISEPELNKKINTFTQEVVSRLGIRKGVIHMEAFLLDSGEIVFLEVGLRAGGAFIVDVSEMAMGVNLKDAGYEIDMNLYSAVEKKLQKATRSEQGYVFGALLVPYSSKQNLRVTSVKMPSFEKNVMVLSLLPKVGDVLTPGDFYANRGVFFFRGENSSELMLIKDSIRDGYKLGVEAIEK